jgi:hypothetical protein
MKMTPDQLHLTEEEVINGAADSQLRAKGINEYMRANSIEGADGRPDFILLTMGRTLDGRILWSYMWKNSLVFRLDMQEAVRQIADVIFAPRRE